MADLHQKPGHPSGSTAEERSRSIEERLACYAHLEENAYDAFKQGERVVIEDVERDARFEPHWRIAASAPQGGWDEMVEATRGGRLEKIDPDRCREVVMERFSVEAMVDGSERPSRRSSPSRVRRERGKGSLLQEQLRSEVIVNIRETMYELDCGCGCHLEGKDAQCLIIKFFLHLEAAHPEIEEPTIELTEEMVTVNLTTQVFPPQRAESRSHERAYPSIRAT